MAAFVFGLEWLQQRTPGRYGDVTPVLLGTAAWWFCWRESPAAAKRSDTFLQSDKL